MEMKKMLSRLFFPLMIIFSLIGCSRYAFKAFSPTLIGETDKTIIWSVMQTGFGVPTNKKDLIQDSKDMVSAVCEHGGRVKLAAIPRQAQSPADAWSMIIECNKGDQEGLWWHQ